jgi:hypothetical protein
MAVMRAPKQWSLIKQETITSFEAWRQNLQYTLSLDPNFAGFLIDGLTRSKSAGEQAVPMCQIKTSLLLTSFCWLNGRELHSPDCRYC